MGRHEIRLRRNRMTSGRIEGYKDYRDLMNKHSRADRLRKAYRLSIIVLGIIGLLFLSYLFFRSSEKSTPTSGVQKISRPGVLINYSLNTENNGKT
ncbi:hypothetical protein [Fulvivirga sp.]|jgi:hypothetical protein|uniref:hypothetical protein n=1 Tax=Fulvivirga sp. TaxID=1931237 RepID=UPI0032EE4B24